MTAMYSCILVPLKNTFDVLVSFIPTIVVAFAILILGYLLAKLSREILEKLFTEVGLDKVMDKLGLSKCLHAGGVKYSLSHILSTVVYLIVLYMFLLVTVNVIGIGVMSALIGSVVVYIYSVITAVMVLVVGHVLGKIIGVLIYLIVSKLGLPEPKLHERVTRWAIVLYAAKISLSQLGLGFLFSGTIFMIWFGGLVFALALAFGLGGRDTAAKYFPQK